MNIQRKYSLPNCTLLLEGLSDAGRSKQFQELRPELSILVNAECYLSGYEQPLAGGREFFESLVRAVSGYAQEFLSTIPNPQAHNPELEMVQMYKIGTNQHRLTVSPELESRNGSDNDHTKPTQELDLNTVQLFDLVEAVDQFFADTQTLPELTLELQSVPRRHAASSEVLLKQAVPAAVGASSLAAAAIVFGLIPAPEVRQPRETVSNSTSDTVKNTDSTTTNAPTTDGNKATTPAQNAATTPPVVKNVAALLNTSPEITDASRLRALNTQVYQQINQGWKNRSGLSEDLVYRLVTAADGAVLAYNGVSETATAAVDKTPFPDLVYNQSNRGSINNEPIAQFKVVFTQNGVLQVSPWHGYNKQSAANSAAITDRKTISDLNQKLSQTVSQNLSGNPSFREDLKYRVAVKKDGAIADYEPLNQAAFDSFRQTPLPNLFQAANGSNVTTNNSEPVANFQVEFRPNGKVEVTPWTGYR